MISQGELKNPEVDWEAVFHPDPAQTKGYALFGMAAADITASPAIDSWVHHLTSSRTRTADGITTCRGPRSKPVMSARPPSPSRLCSAIRCLAEKPNLPAASTALANGCGPSNPRIRKSALINCLASPGLANLPPTCNRWPKLSSLSSAKTVAGLSLPLFRATLMQPARPCMRFALALVSPRPTQPSNAPNAICWKPSLRMAVVVRQTARLAIPADHEERLPTRT